MTQKVLFLERKVILLSVIFLMGFLFSCKKEDTDFGSNIQPSGDLLGNTFIDTLSLVTYSVPDDSMRTEGTTRNLLGSYVDPVFGKMDCGFISHFRLESDEPNFGDLGSLTVDSVVLSLTYNGAYGDLTPQKFVVYRITEDIDAETDYFRYSQIAYDPVDLVEPGYDVITPDIFSPVIDGNDTLAAQLRIRLSNSFGEEIVNQSGTGNLANNDAFISWMKGLYVAVDNPSQQTGEGAVFYFNLLETASRLNLYFTESGIQRRINFNINSNSARINVIHTDYSGTRIQEMFDDNSFGQEEFYYQSGGIRSVIEFPHLFELKEQLGNFIVNKAELVLPVQYLTDDLLVPPLELTIAYFDKETNSQFLVTDNSKPAHLDGEYNKSEKLYRFNITRHIQNVLTGELPNEGLRLLSLEHFSSVERIVFNGPATSKKLKPRLELTLTTY